MHISRSRLAATTVGELLRSAWLVQLQGTLPVLHSSLSRHCTGGQSRTHYLSVQRSHQWRCCCAGSLGSMKLQCSPTWGTSSVHKSHLHASAA